MTMNNELKTRIDNLEKLNKELKAENAMLKQHLINISTENIGKCCCAEEYVDKVLENLKVS